MENKKIYGVIGLVIMLSGMLFFAQTKGWIDLSTAGRVKLSTTSGQQLGISVNTRVDKPVTSVVVSGNTYQWKTTSKNTGTVSWDNAWILVRIAIPESTTTELCNHVDECTGATIGNCFTVEKCSYGTDVQNCREDIKNTWKLQYSTDGNNWMTPSCTDECGNYGKVCALDFAKTVIPGQEETMYFKVTVPESAENADYPLITSLMAYAGGTYGIASDTDNLTVGTISGRFLMEALGLLSMIGGAALAVVGFAL